MKPDWLKRPEWPTAHQRAWTALAEAAGMVPVARTRLMLANDGHAGELATSVEAIDRAIASLTEARDLLHGGQGGQ